MKLIIDIHEEEYISIRKQVLENITNPLKVCIANGKPYDKVIDEVTELLENEWGYEGMKDDVARIMKGGEEE